MGGFYVLKFGRLETGRKLLKNESTLVAIAGIDAMATPVIINTSFIKNYSQPVPSISAINPIKSAEDFQDPTLRLESITVWNAIIIP
jgi:hypothetical protein